MKHAEKTLSTDAETRSLAAPPLPVAGPCVIVIFGATGDLARRKLLPALFNLACEGCIRETRFKVLGLGRTEMDDEQFRARLREAVEQSALTRGFTVEAWERFAARLHYSTGDVNDADTFNRLA
ncbi:MAG TPA: hypothetical protein VNO14_13005, partial [Blastocatellia bacterium]|nr:hypothetical protein [Blastocatellia bacterium]